MTVAVKVTGWWISEGDPEVVTTVLDVVPAMCSSSVADVLAALLGSPVCTYLVAWRGRHSSVRRGASLIFASISALVGFVGTVAYAIPALDDLHNDAVPLGEAVLGNIIIWAICASAWIIAVRCALFALRKNPSGEFSS